jgi:hypothetical protein
MSLCGVHSCPATTTMCRCVILDLSPPQRYTWSARKSKKLWYVVVKQYKKERETLGMLTRHDL